jgi:hypothetical protein
MSQPKDVLILDEIKVPAPAQPVQPVGEGAAILSMIERAAKDPSVDIEKFERLMAMRERIDSQQAKRDFNDAMARAKGEIGPIVKNRVADFTSQKGRTNYRYEDFAAVAKAVDPVFSKHGLDYRFRSAQEGQRVRVTCIISGHGHSEETTLECPEDHSGNKNAVQAVASASQYLMRYTLKLAIGLSVTEDDDGTSASCGGSDPINADQYAELLRVADSVGATQEDENQLLRLYKIESLHHLPASKLAEAIARIKQKGARK